MPSMQLLWRQSMSSDGGICASAHRGRKTLTIGVLLLAYVAVAVTFADDQSSSREERPSPGDARSVKSSLFPEIRWNSSCFKRVSRVIDDSHADAVKILGDLLGSLKDLGVVKPERSSCYSVEKIVRQVLPNSCETSSKTFQPTDTNDVTYISVQFIIRKSLVPTTVVTEPTKTPSTTPTTVSSEAKNENCTKNTTELVDLVQKSRNISRAMVVANTTAPPVHRDDIVLGKTQILVIATCSAVIGTFFIVAAILRIRNCVKRQRSAQMLTKRPDPAFRGCSFSLTNSAGHSGDQLLGGVNKSGSKTNGFSVEESQWSVRGQAEVNATANPPVLVVTEPSTTNTPTSSMSSQDEIWPKTKEANNSCDEDNSRADIPLMRCAAPQDNPSNIVTIDKFMDLSIGLVSPTKKATQMNTFVYHGADDVEALDAVVATDANHCDEFEFGDISTNVPICKRGITGLSQSDTSIDSPPSYRYGNQVAYDHAGYSNAAYTSPKTRDNKKQPYQIPQTCHDTFDLNDSNEDLVESDKYGRNRRSLPAISTYDVIGVDKTQRNRAGSKPDVKSVMYSKPVKL